MKNCLFIILLLQLGCSLRQGDFGSDCPKEMVRVFAPKQGVDLCVDRFELTMARPPWDDDKPLTNQNYYSCEKHCKSWGKRLLTHKEWQVACEGTIPQKCNIHRTHPIIRKLTSRVPWIFAGHNCRHYRKAWGLCMQDPSLNELVDSLAVNQQFPDCVSKYGVRHMVGNLGEWVADLHHRKKQLRGRFNGGLYPQPKSSCNYTTIAHGPRYRDYSIGCRCAQKPKVDFFDRWSL